MKPVSPVLPGCPNIPEVVFAKDQPEYVPLPAVIMDKATGIPVMTRWRLTDDERRWIAAGGEIVLTQMTFGRSLQPVHLQVVVKGDLPETDHLILKDATKNDAEVPQTEGPTEAAPSGH